MKKLTLGKDKVVSGVYSGIADYLEVDVSFVRIITRRVWLHKLIFKLMWDERKHHFAMNPYSKP